ncbi:MAG: GspMb/PilO family protein [Pseudomonadota bacterium]
MSAHTRSSIQAWMGWALARLGRPGQFGLALLAGGLITCIGVVHPLEADNQALAAQAQQLARRPPPPSAEVSEQAWLARLPADHAGHGYLAKLFAAAEAAGIALEEGRYRDARDPDSGLNRLSIVLPVSGSYPALRAFLAKALTQEPSLALEGLRLFRDSIEDGEVQGEVRFLLILGGRP